MAIIAITTSNSMRVKPARRSCDGPVGIRLGLVLRASMVFKYYGVLNWKNIAGGFVVTGMAFVKVPLPLKTPVVFVIH